MIIQGRLITLKINTVCQGVHDSTYVYVDQGYIATPIFGRFTTSYFIPHNELCVPILQEYLHTQNNRDPLVQTCSFAFLHTYVIHTCHALVALTIGHV